uniref:Uncharacterized protein n=1 Tax=Acrobeloides nanus TaxID=290746 RepID=A0A914DEV3_9BILA
MNTTLRGAHSTPYILGRIEEKENEPHRSNRMLNNSDDLMLKMNSVHFNAGCSSSSTDLNTLVQFYNESADPEIIRQWMNIYQEHKQTKCNSESPLRWQSKEKNYSDSADNLTKTSDQKSSTNTSPQKCAFNRSMDALQGNKEGFFALAKCYSADFPTKIEMPTSRLIRTKEMPDITDVDDAEEY